jgi:hypothetical protein
MQSAPWHYEIFIPAIKVLACIVVATGTISYFSLGSILKDDICSEKEGDRMKEQEADS